MQGFGQTRRLTLMDLVIRLAMELSEPQRGTWTDVKYEYDTENKQDLNELAWMINIAQDFTCRHLYDKSFAFFESEFHHPVVPHVGKYRLPGDFVAIESVFHHRGQDYCEVTETNIKEFEKHDSYGSIKTHISPYGKEDFYSYYEVRGNIGETIHSDQVTENSLTTVKGDFDTDVIRVGDTLQNEIDGSVGEITSVSETEVEIDMLSGGRTNVFQEGDPYSIESAAQPYECLRIYPRVQSVGEDTLWEGSADRVTVAYPRSVTRIKFRLDAIPPTLNPRTARIYIMVQEADSNVVASGFLTEPLEAGENVVDMVGEIEGETEYYVRGTTHDYLEDPPGMRIQGTQFVPDSVEVFEATGRDTLAITYTRLPKPMVKYDSANDSYSFDAGAVCEFPPYCADAIIGYAKILAYQKKSGMPHVDENLMSGFRLAIEAILQVLRKRGESGNKNMFTNPHSTSRVGGHPYVYPGFTNEVIFP